MATSTMTRPVGSRSRPIDGRGRSRPSDRRPKRRWIRAVVLALVLVLIGTAVWLLAFSSVLATRTVAVSRTSVLTAAEIRTAAAVPIGLPLARQDLDAVARRVAALPPVESVQITRRWPDAVAIEVTERSPVLSIKSGAGYLLVDRFGIAYQTVGWTPDGVVPATVDPTNGPVLVDVAAVAGELPGKILSRVDTISAVSATTIAIQLNKGPKLIWGTRDQTALKAEIVSSFLDQKKSYRQIDVTAPHNPAVR